MPLKPLQLLRRGRLFNHKVNLAGLHRRRFASPAKEDNTRDIYDVVCVGGGPAGLSLLAGLRSSPTTSGLRVALIESQDLAKNVLHDASSSSYSNRCSSLTPASVRYLQDIGAWDYVDQSRVQPYHEMQVWDGLTGARISFDWTQASDYFFPPFSTSRTASDPVAYMIENINITTALQRHLAALGGADIFSPARVESISFGRETATADLRTWPAVTLSNGRTLTARLLVGADGANSPVRTFAGIASRGWDYGRHGVVATLRLSAARSRSEASSGQQQHRIAYQRFLPTGPVALLPLPGDMASLVWSTLPERAARLKALPTPDLVAMVNAAFRLGPVDLTYLHSLASGQADEVAWRMQHAPAADAHSKLPTPVVDVQDGSVAAFPLKMRHADTYTADRVALLGDAAHTIHPLAGQGLNQGQADAAALARAIAAALRAGMDIGAPLALAPYTAERFADNGALLGVCDKLHKLYSVRAGPLVPLRSWGLRVVDKMGFAKGFLMRRAAGA